MAHLLERLADLTLGHAAPVQPVLRGTHAPAPFVEEVLPLPLEQVVETEAPAGGHEAAARPQLRQGKSEALVPRPRTGEEPARGQRAPAATAPVGRSQQPTPREDRPEPAGRPASPRAAVIPVVETTLLASPSATETPRAIGTPHAVEAPLVAAPIARRHAATVAAAAAAAGAPAAASIEHMAYADADASPGAKATPHAHEARPRASAGRAQGSRERSTPAGDGSIVVTIGRVDVRAVLPPPAPRSRAAPPARGGVTLQDYVRKRDRRDPEGGT